MPDLKPRQTNFYSRQTASTVTNKPVQIAGSSRNKNQYSARANNNRVMPGVSRSNKTNATPAVFFPGLINPADVVNTSELIYETQTVQGEIPYQAYNGYISPSYNRLNANGLPLGGEYDIGITSSTIPVVEFSATAVDEDAEDRVVISDQTGLFIGTMPIFSFLATTKGVLFPYTPTISVSHTANYEIENLVHTNYPTPYYTNSTVNSINIQGRFTAQTETEGQYILAMMHFFRTATKMFYGQSTNKGSPPPVLYLDAHGPYLFDHIPVVIREFQYSLPNDTNYITTSFGRGINKVPTDLNVSVDLIPVYSRNKISTEFGLDGFANGNLLTGYNRKEGQEKSGGWL